MSILTRGKKDNTYKFALARYLLDYANRQHTNREIPYRDIASEFLKYYWHQECKFRIRQSGHTKRLPSIVTIIREEFGEKYVPYSFSDAPEHLVERAEEKILKKIFGHARRKTSLVVPKFQNIPKGNRAISNPVFYDHDDDRQVIILKPNVIGFLQRYYTPLLKGVFLEWAKFLEKINHLPLLIAKIESDEINRTSLKKYIMVFKDFDHCFYCNSRLAKDRHTHVDHFIPWSYIFEDEAWNLVLSCSSCNLKKSDSLPQKAFLNDLIARNESFQEKIEDLKKSITGLDTDKGWRSEMKYHYKNCYDYGFDTVKMP